MKKDFLARQKRIQYVFIMTITRQTNDTNFAFQLNGKLGNMLNLLTRDSSCRLCSESSVCANLPSRHGRAPLWRWFCHSICICVHWAFCPTEIPLKYSNNMDQTRYSFDRWCLGWLGSRTHLLWRTDSSLILALHSFEVHVACATCQIIEFGEAWFLNKQWQTWNKPQAANIKNNRKESLMISLPI